MSLVLFYCLREYLNFIFWSFYQIFNFCYQIFNLLDFLSFEYVFYKHVPL